MAEQATAMPSISALEEFCRDLADDILGTHDKTPSGERGFDWKSLVEILIPIVTQLLVNCPLSRSELLAAIRRPSLKQRSYAKSVCRDNCRGANRPRLRDLWGSISDRLAFRAEKLDEPTLNAVVDEALSPESYLGV